MGGNKSAWTQEGSSVRGPCTLPSAGGMGVNNFLLVVGVFVGLFAAAVALKCYQCGMYNDGVGSITPCLNETYMKLIECPMRENNYCIDSHKKTGKTACHHSASQSTYRENPATGMVGPPCETNPAK
ncbi:hypothetical protein NQ318_002093 [Aromia moschata]|uniref:Uncharacterized protein n=1 Tax=Aromia moschata TaxID=1265417 RepID=A0AAV8Y8A8_9CUCU|nr:hypothetical protein NQ318_002093 [Aromia moschata]